MSFLSGLLSWNHRAALSKQVMSEDKIKFQRALDAEDNVAAAVEGLGHLSDHIHVRKRVFVPEQGRSREIDVIAVCSSLYVVEVKNWSGKVWRNEDRWFQLPPRAGARALEFNDVLAEVEYKARALVRYLQKNNIDVPAGSVRAVVVFTSAKVDLCPTTIRNHPSVFTAKSFQETVERRSAWNDLVTTWAPQLFAGKSEITPPLRARINSVLSSVRTWDVLILHNGTRHQGDLKWIKLPEYTEWQDSRDREPFLNVQRPSIASASLSWASASWWGALSAAWQGSAGMLQVQLKKGVRLVKPENKKRGLKAPKPGPTAAVDDLHPAVLQIPLSHKSSKRAVTDVNHVVFLPAGHTGPIQVALSEIARLEVSERPDDDPR
jgi:hypothetical protein